MATIDETIWVNNTTELQNTVQTLIGQGGTVTNQSEGAVTVKVKRELNVVMLVVLLVLFCIPGLAYLIWHFTANVDQVVTVRVGQPSNIGGYRPENEPGAGLGTVHDAVSSPASLTPGGADPWMTPPPASPGHGVQDAVQPGYGVQDAVQPGYAAAPPPPPPPPTGF